MFADARILNVNLSTGKIKTDILSGSEYRKYPGGSILATYLILKNMKAKVDPLSPENILVFAVSPLTGLPISGNSRVVVAAKSPLTGTIGDSQAGGFFPASLKANDYDAIMFTGKADKPVYLYIDGEDVSLRSAQNIWGKITGESEDLIRGELNENNVDIALIGPGGENLVKMPALSIIKAVLMEEMV